MTETERQQLFTDLKQQATDTVIPVVSQNTNATAEIVQSLSQEQLALAEGYLAQYKTPLQLDGENSEKIQQNFEKTTIGDLDIQTIWTMNSSANNQQKNTQYPSLNFAHPKDFLSSKDFSVITPESNKYKNSAFAYQKRSPFTHEDKIYIQRMPEYSEETIQKLTQEGFNFTVEYNKWNQFAVTSVLYHEATHFKHNKYDGMGDLKHPIDKAKADRATEKMAFAVENMYIANQYMTLKQQGIETVEINGEQHPIETLLDLYPNIKDEVLQNGFDPNDKGSVRKIVELSSQFWDENREKDYKGQHISNASSTTGNFSDILGHDDQQYDQTISKMLQNIYIGNNTKVDLSDCRDLMDNLSTEKAQELLADHPINPELTGVTFKKMNEINTHLESLGIKDDAAKQKYLENNFESIVFRSGEHDEKLKAILLDTPSEKKNTIVYADNLTEKIDEKGHHIISDGTNSVDITAYQSYKELAQNMSNANKLHQFSINKIQSENSSTQSPENTIPSKKEPTLSALTIQKSISNGR